VSGERQPLLSEISRSRKLGLLLRHLAPGSRVLEVGCGDGWLTRRLRARGHRVTTVDLVADADLRGDILQWRQLGLAEGSFDAVVALEVIEHVDCIGALTDLCAPGGIVFLSSPHPRWDWVMQVLEGVHLTQPRTSPHCNLTDFRALAGSRLRPVVLKRPLGIHQVGVFRRLPAAAPGAA
jgi:2-polyprenyl-3-methyl-5-hydroxy-6-metoxy-1,4-benzoquinol methylase